MLNSHIIYCRGVKGDSPKNWNLIHFVTLSYMQISRNPGLKNKIYIYIYNCILHNRGKEAGLAEVVWNHKGAT